MYLLYGNYLPETYYEFNWKYLNCIGNWCFSNISKHKHRSDYVYFSKLMTADAVVNVIPQYIILFKHHLGKILDLSFLTFLFVCLTKLIYVDICIRLKILNSMLA